MSRKQAVDAFAAARPIDFPFLVLAGVFMAALVVCNLIARLMVSVDLGFHVFTVSAGILPYPVTFLVTDVLSEIYGRRRASRIVLAGFFASLFVLGVVWLAEQFPSVADSLVTRDEYKKVIADNAGRAILASMVAYLVAQYVDVVLFHFWRSLTDGRHLWLRNNASTILSQFVDSTLVIVILYYGVDGWPDDRMVTTIRDMWVLKTLMAVVDTPFCYLAVGLLRRWRARPL